ncbi:MAG: type II toxin-antitoxin system VapC family toxin [Armatimonadetes bacterium]|nr:type II toxin-antitoxin system VapC family toxin [Armatimonadota bacterium]
MSRIYVETTIPSFYHEVRLEPEMVARRNWTRRWWTAAFGVDELVTGAPVIDELERGRFPGQADALSLLGALPVLVVTAPVLEIVEVYIRHGAMPADPHGDALHLALAAFHRCDCLVTWNCRHLANARKFPHIQRVHGILGLGVPSLVTPLELLDEV